MSNKPTPQPWSDSLCNNHDTHCHTLDCGHIVFSSSSSSNKSACSPNCIRAVYFQKPQLPLSWLKNTSLSPFTCPQCVETCVRLDYDSMIQKHRERGGRLANSKDTNVRLWTYTAILEMIEAGGRMCESLVGPFKTHDIQAYQALTDIRTVEVIQGTISELEGMTRWDMRDAPNMMTRSSNRETELDADDASRVALLRAQHEEQPDKQHAELDDLADWLGGAKVGDGDGDVDMEDLATNLESFRA